MKNLFRAAGLGAVVAWAGIAMPTIAADPIADFYRGKQIEFIIGTTPGNSFDSWVRTLSAHWGKYIPGNPTFLPKNMPGGGQIIATNYLYNKAPRDGTSVAMVSRNMPTQAVLGMSSVQFKAEEFAYIGSPELTNRICVVMAGKVNSEEDLFKKEIVLGGAGAGTAVSTTPVLLKGLLGMNFRLVEGYLGATEVLLAMDRGEVDGICQTLGAIDSSRPGWIEQGKLKVLFNMEPKEIPRLKAPSIYKYVKTEEQKAIIAFFNSSVELGRPVSAPPGLPPERVEMLRRTFEKTLQDPAFKEDIAKQKLVIDLTPGEELQTLVAKVAKTPRAVIDKTIAIVGTLGE
jgi:tripartite-type tricarboxylate transporter receptor subunit TctC